MGRVLLADLPTQELDDFLASTKLERYTPKTIAEPDDLRAALAEVRKQGWALVDEELEVGLRSVAAPIRSADGRTIAAMNVSAAASRVSLEELQEHFLPKLLRTADLISASLVRGAASRSRSW
jgi:IclR family pca regulon transcriptional regulator